MIEQGPGTAAEVVNFTSTLVQDEAIVSDTRGQFSGDHAHCFVYDGSLLHVSKSTTGEMVSCYDFLALGGSITHGSPNILCVVSFNAVNVLVGLDDGKGCGLLCLFNFKINKVLRAISVPQVVTCVETLCSDTNSVDLGFLTTSLQGFAGVVACGTKRGEVYIVDMCLNIVVSAQDVPMKLHCLDFDTITMCKAAVVASHEVPCFRLSNQESDDCFTYVSPGSSLHRFSTEDVYISSLKFIPQIASLCVGFSFGSFQLWRTNPLALDYSSQIEANSLPVSHFAYQEPENDPRSFCYLWVGRCCNVASMATLSDSMEEYIHGSVASIQLHQMAYDSKTVEKSGSILFNDLMQVGCVLERSLAPAADVLASWILSCGTLSSLKSIRTVDEDSRMAYDPLDTNLALFSWCVRYTDGATTSHMALFDINRWYHAQMPKEVRVAMGWCTYFSQYSFDDIIGESPCLDVAVETKTFTCYKCPRGIKKDRFLDPASLSFKASFLTPEGTVSTRYRGLQRQALVDIIDAGHMAVVSPSAGFQKLVDANIIANNTTSQVTQRRGILTAMLLHSHTEFIIQCIENWSSGKFAQASCDVRLITSWLWDVLMDVITEFDRSCLCLYDWSAVPLDKSTRESLVSAYTQTNNIHLLLKHLNALAQETPTTQLGALELAEKLAVTSMRLQHMKVILWCISTGLLPELKEETTSVGLYSYPCTTLRRCYNNRRSELLLLNSELNDRLMVDHLCGVFGDQLTSLLKDERGNGRYPLPNMRAAVNVFLLDASLQEKISLFLYVVLDLMSLSHEELNNAISSRLPTLLESLPGDFSKLTDVATALWSLDHKEFYDMVEVIRQPGACFYLTAHQCELILVSLLAQGQERAALNVLDLCGSRQHISMKTLLRVYLSNRLVAISVDCVRANGDRQAYTELVSMCFQYGLIGELLCLPLTDDELIGLKGLLEDKDSLDTYVIHLLQNGDVAEAVNLNNKLKARPLWRSDQKLKDRAATRSKIIDWYLATLPPIQKSFLEDPSLFEKQRMTRKILAKPMYVPFLLNQLAKGQKPTNLSKTIRSMAPSPTADYRPFLESLTPSVKKTKPLSAVCHLSERKLQSVTGLFDLHSRSPKRHQAFEPDEGSLSIKKPALSACDETGVRALLRTPLVRRKSPLQSTALVATPHSILKVRKPVLKSSPATNSPTLRFPAGVQSATNLPTSLAGKDTKGRCSPGAGEVMRHGQSLLSTAKSSRVHWGSADELMMSPKVISFEESFLEPAVAVSAHEVTSEDSGEIEFNFSAPLKPVLTAHLGYPAAHADGSYSLQESCVNDSNAVEPEYQEACSASVESFQSAASGDEATQPEPCLEAMETNTSIEQHEYQGVEMEVDEPLHLSVDANSDAQPDHEQTLQGFASTSSSASSDVQCAYESHRGLVESDDNSMPKILSSDMSCTGLDGSPYKPPNLTCASSEHLLQVNPSTTVSPAILEASKDVSNSSPKLKSTVEYHVSVALESASPKKQTDELLAQSNVSQNPRSLETSILIKNSDVSSPGLSTFQVYITDPSSALCGDPVSVVQESGSAGVHVNITSEHGSVEPEGTKSLADMTRQVELSGTALEKPSCVTLTAEVVGTDCLGAEWRGSPDVVATEAVRPEMVFAVSEASQDAALRASALASDAKASGLVLRSLWEQALNQPEKLTEPDGPATTPKRNITSLKQLPESTTCVDAPEPLANSYEAVPTTSTTGLSRFYFSPAINVATPDSVAAADQLQQQFIFTPPTEASKAMIVKKIRPFRTVLPEGMFGVEEDQLHGSEAASNDQDFSAGAKSTRSRGRIAPYKFVADDDLDTQTQRSTRSKDSGEKKVRPFEVQLPEGMFDEPRVTRSRLKSKEVQEPIETTNVMPKSPSRRGRSKVELPPDPAEPKSPSRNRRSKVESALYLELPIAEPKSPSRRGQANDDEHSTNKPPMELKSPSRRGRSKVDSELPSALPAAEVKSPSRRGRNKSESASNPPAAEKVVPTSPARRGRPPKAALTAIHSVAELPSQSLLDNMGLPSLTKSNTSPSRRGSRAVKDGERSSPSTIHGLELEQKDDGGGHHTESFTVHVHKSTRTTSKSSSKGVESIAQPTGDQPRGKKTVKKAKPGSPQRETEVFTLTINEQASPPSKTTRSRSKKTESSEAPSATKSISSYSSNSEPTTRSLTRLKTRRQL